MTADRPESTERILRAAVSADRPRRVRLDPAFQGLPDTAHGGAVLALFDALAGMPGPRLLSATYRRRVPLDTPLTLDVSPGEGTTAFRLVDRDTILVEGAIGPDGGASGGAPEETARRRPDVGLAKDRDALPISRTCFACGIDNPLGLRAQLSIDDGGVGGVWNPEPAFRAPGADGLSVVTITTLLDEAAFWLGAAASGESGMTTELRVRIHRAPVFGAVVFGGSRAGVRPHVADPRYWATSVAAWEASGALVATAEITFVAVRGAARKLVTGLLALNPAETLRRVFPAYVG